MVLTRPAAPDPAEIIAEVAVATCAGLGVPLVVEFDGTTYGVRRPETPALGGFMALATIIPGETKLGLFKRIATAKQFGVPVPAGTPLRPSRARDVVGTINPPPEPVKPPEETAEAPAVAPKQATLF